MSDIKTDAPAAPTVVDDDGTGRTGTRLDEAWYDDLLDAINHQCYSESNPATTPADVIDEVIEARSVYADLDARLDTFATSASVVDNITETQLMGGLGGVNIVVNDDFLIWAAEAGGDGTGQTAAPTGYYLSGASATLTRCGTGLADTTRKIGDFCCKVTRSGTDVDLQTRPIQSTAFTRADFLKGQYVCGGAWVKCSTPNVARVYISDNVGTTYSSYHTGGGTWEWLPVTRQLSQSATAILAGFWVGTADVSAYVSGLTALILNDNFDLTRYIPSPVTYGMFHFSFAGNLSATSNAGRVVVARPGIVKDIQCHLKTAPAGQPVIWDLNTWDGSSFTSMCSTKPQVAATETEGGAQPDATYARRCLNSMSGATKVIGGIVTVDIDQVGAGTTGADAVVEARILQYNSPLERFQTY